MATQEQEKPTEHGWNLWFQLLPAWDQHTVLNHELDWYDEYMAGQVSFQELRERCADLRGDRQPISK